MLTVAIVGSRRYPHAEQVRAFVARLATKYPSCTVVSDAANRVDSMAAAAACAQGLAVCEYPAEWDRYGRGTGFKRTRDIVQPADVVAFWDGQSRDTQHTISLARPPTAR